MKTKKVIYNMLVENTGISLLDSGDAYGRHWQRNREKTIKDFGAEPEVSYYIYDDGDIDYRVSVYHYLLKFFDEETDKICDKFNRLQDNDNHDEWAEDNECDIPLYGVTVDGWEYLKKILKKDNNYMGEEWTNTYNYDNALSQVLQFNVLTINDNKYCLLQIHNGCDVRGGYTKAKLFKMKDTFDEYMYFGITDVYGVYNGKNISNMYDGYNLTYDDTNKIVTIDKNSEVDLSLWMAEY